MMRQHSNDESFPIIPAAVRISEFYYYEALVSDVTRAGEVLSPKGLIEFSISNNEIQYHLKNSSQKLEDYFNELREQILKKKIEGFITLYNYQHTDIDEVVFFNRDENLPLVETILSAFDSNQLVKLSPNHDWFVQLEYKPILLRDIEIYLQTDVYDEENLAEKFLDRHSLFDQVDEQIEKNLTQQVAYQISSQVGLENTLIIEFWLELKFPQHLNDALSSLPFISYVTLQWPFPSPQRYLKLSIDGKFVDIYFNPENSSLEWFNVPFVENIHEDINMDFFTPKMRLEVHEPVEFYNLTTLSGKIHIQAPFLISGMQVNVSQKDIDEKIDISSNISFNFEMHLDDRFARKRYSPYQHIQFPNVLLTEMRVADIVLLLRDMQFKLDSEPISEKKLVDKDDQEKNKPTQFTITASRNEAGSKLVLWILVEGLPSGTTREREIPGKEKFITPYPTGSTVIYIRGELEGDNQRVVRTINNLHRKLKERFRHIKLME